jgi:hypothetical protein
MAVNNNDRAYTSLSVAENQKLSEKVKHNAATMPEPKITN